MPSPFTIFIHIPLLHPKAMIHPRSARRNYRNGLTYKSSGCPPKVHLLAQPHSRRKGGQFLSVTQFHYLICYRTRAKFFPSVSRDGVASKLVTFFSDQVGTAIHKWWYSRPSDWPRMMLLDAWSSHDWVRAWYGCSSIWWYPGRVDFTYMNLLVGCCMIFIYGYSHIKKIHRQQVWCPKEFWQGLWTMSLFLTIPSSSRHFWP